MSKVVVLAHAPCAAALVQAAEGVLGRSIDLTVIDVPMQQPRNALPVLHARVQALGADQCVILTDLPGSTPHRMALETIDKSRGAVVTGINLAMLIRAINYMDLGTNELAARCQDIGVRSIEWSDTHAV